MAQSTSGPPTADPQCQSLLQEMALSLSENECTGYRVSHSELELLGLSDDSSQIIGPSCQAPAIERVATGRQHSDGTAWVLYCVLTDVGPTHILYTERGSNEGKRQAITALGCLFYDGVGVSKGTLHEEFPADVKNIVGHGAASRDLREFLPGATPTNDDATGDDDPVEHLMERVDNQQRTAAENEMSHITEPMVRAAIDDQRIWLVPPQSSAAWADLIDDVVGLAGPRSQREEKTLRQEVRQAIDQARHAEMENPRNVDLSGLQPVYQVRYELDPALLLDDDPPILPI